MKNVTALSNEDLIKNLIFCKEKFLNFNILIENLLKKINESMSIEDEKFLEKEIFDSLLLNEKEIFSISSKLFPVVEVLNEEKISSLIAKNYSQYEKKEGWQYNITERFLYFRLPELTPKPYAYVKKSKKSDRVCDYSAEKFMEKSLNLIKKKSNFIKSWNCYTIIFIHHYAKTKEISDPDNYDIKKIIDAIGPFLVKKSDLSGLDIMQFSEEDDSNFTEIYVVKGKECGEEIIKTISRLKPF